MKSHGLNAAVFASIVQHGDRGDDYQIYNGVYLLPHMARFVRKEDRGPMEVRLLKVYLYVFNGMSSFIFALTT